MKIDYVFLPLVVIFLLVFGFVSALHPLKMQEILFRIGLNKVQKEIMGEKVHLVFLRVLGVILIGIALLILSGFIKMLKS